MAGYKQSQLKNKSFVEIQKLFDKAMTRVNMFVDKDTELVKESSKKAEAEMAQESSSKRAGEELEQEVAKKQKIDNVQEEAEMKKLIKVVPDEEEVAIDAIPLSTKPSSIVDYKIIKEGKISIYQIIRADGSSKLLMKKLDDFEDKYQVYGRIVGIKRLHNDLRVTVAQRTVTVVGARETVGSQVVHQTGIQCFNCKEFGHFAKECWKPKRVKDFMYHKKKMLLCKQAEKGVPLQAEHSDWLADTDEEIDKQELEAHYSYMAKIQEVPTADSGTDTEPLEQVQYDPEYNVFANERHHFEQPEPISNTCVVEKVDSNVIPDSPDMCDNDIQSDQNAEDERVALANLIANLKLDVDENKRFKIN
ncbi:gag-pol polyprotein [Tanacetum coccineum]